MMKSILCLLLFLSFAQARTNLLLVGGGHRPAEAMKEFVALAGSEKSYILIIPWASETIESAEMIKTEFQTHNAGRIEIVPHQIFSKDLDVLLSGIEKATGIFFTGGNQNILMSVINEFKLADIFKKKFREGAVFGGTSAGTAIMSNPMLTGNADLSVLDGSKVELAEGLGLLPNGVIVDQHFIIRSRFNRLGGLILADKAVLGIGVDENTSLLIKDKDAQVIGPTQVLLFKKTGDNKLEISVINPGMTFKF
jgi:cyanophycinase